MNRILELAYKTWCAGAGLRSRRHRYKSYTYGDQWCDTVRDRHGRYMREDARIIESGSKPLTNNLIRQLVKTVVGRYRTQSAESGLYSGEVAEPARRNGLAELDSRLLEEFLISGCAIQRVVDERRWEGSGLWVDNVNPRDFFVNRFNDPRGLDIELVGMLHDMSFAEVVNRFGDGSRAKVEELGRLYRKGGMSEAYSTLSLGECDDADDFFRPRIEGRCRVIEVWNFDSRCRADGASLDFVWHCRWLSPDGSVLREYDSPFGHGGHPFVVKFYPLTDGEVHSFVEDVIDQQRYINRLIVMLDRILMSSAKGVLIFPEDQRLPGMRWEDITDVWARSDGVIPVTGKGMHLPQQVMSDSGNTGAYQLLNMQLKLFEDISGVGDALLGRSNGSARGVEMFDTQVRNATIALADIFDTFTAFVEKRNGLLASAKPRQEEIKNKK